MIPKKCVKKVEIYIKTLFPESYLLPRCLYPDTRMWE